MMENLEKPHKRIDFKQRASDFRDPRLTFSVSTRNIKPDIDIIDYLSVYFLYCNINQIESVFGSTIHFSRLYGGRVTPAEFQLTDIQVARLEESGIHLALTLTNHFFDQEAYRESWKLLETHHKKGNAIVITNDQLARHLKKDFPLYELKASILKNLNTLTKVKRALELYDSLTLPMDKNDDDDFLNSLPEKGRMILFGNANCAYTCPARTCYLGFSQEIFGKPVTSLCSKKIIPRLDMGHVYFDVKNLADMGFTRFKMVPLAQTGAEDVSRAISHKKNYPLNFLRKHKQLYYLCSFPKSGRTWLRFILANYINLYYKLGMQIDLHSQNTLLPNDNHSRLIGFDMVCFPTDSRFPLVIASHHEYNQEVFLEEADERIIFLMRSMPDALVSFYFHSSRALDFFEGSLKDFLHDRRQGLERLCKYLNAWAPILQNGKSFILTYEKLHENPEKTIAGLLAYLKIPVEAELVSRVVQMSSFETMQALEKQSGMPGQERGKDDPEALRMRKGEVGGSQEYLDAEDWTYIETTCNQMLNPQAKELLRQHELWREPLEEDLS